jgi:hypothetical protein
MTGFGLLSFDDLFRMRFCSNPDGSPRQVTPGDRRWVDAAVNMAKLTAAIATAVISVADPYPLVIYGRGKVHGLPLERLGRRDLRC